MTKCGAWLKSLKSTTSPQAWYRTTSRFQNHKCPAIMPRMATIGLLVSIWGGPLIYQVGRGTLSCRAHSLRFLGRRIWTMSEAETWDSLATVVTTRTVRLGISGWFWSMIFKKLTMAQWKLLVHFGWLSLTARKMLITEKTLSMNFRFRWHSLCRTDQCTWR